jgi:hypothetical protein
MVYPYRRAGHGRFRPAIRRCAAIRCAAHVDGFGCDAAPLLCVFVCVFVRVMRCSVCAFVCFFVCVCLRRRVYEPIFKPLAYFARVRSIEVLEY